MEQVAKRIKKCCTGEFLRQLFYFHSRMKKLLKSYGTFTRTERMGLVALSALLIILIGVRATMHLWIHPDFDSEKEKKLLASWENYKRSQPSAKADTIPNRSSEFADADDDGETPLPDVININTADSATLVRLRGIGPVSAGKIVARRKNIGPFTDVNQLKEVCVINSSVFEILKKHLSVN